MHFVRRIAAAALAAGLVSSVFAAGPLATRAPLFDKASFRPQVALLDVTPMTSAPVAGISGVVFSHAPLEKVTVGTRTAHVRPAEPRDLQRLVRMPLGASEAPYRTFFEVPDASLARIGANDIDIVAKGSDGRTSDAHRVTVLRAAPARP